MLKREGNNLESVLEKDRTKLRAKKEADNVVHFTDYLPVGKHFFYFIYRNDYIFLSPKYDITRFKGTNVFLNQIRVKERTKELVQVTLGRNVYTQEAVKFNKDKSVFKDFQEDTPEFLMRMLEQDLAYGKLVNVKECRNAWDDVKKKLFEHYLIMKNIFLYLASNSSFPTMSMNDITEFVRRSDLFGKNLPMARMD